MATKRKFLSLQEKIDIIEYSGKFKCGIRELADKFGVGKTQISTILQKREEILLLFGENGDLSRKTKFRKTEGASIDAVVFEWFLAARKNNIPISGPIIQEKARDAAQALGIEGFCAANGWLSKFRTRHNIEWKSVVGESADVSSELTDNWKKQLPLLTEGYEEKDIYNADETGLFYRALPNKTLSIKGETCAGGKMSKERITILFCCSMTGEKEKPLVIGKSLKPRCFRGIDGEKLGVTWKANKKAWMTRTLMEEWLLNFDKKMRREKRKVLLFLDNASSHPNLQLKNVKISFLPPNTTSMCQPLDQGIIKMFKSYYRQMILKDLITKMQATTSASSLAKSITVLDAINWINFAWGKTSPESINKCFLKSGFHKAISASDDEYLFFEPDENEDFERLLSHDLIDNSNNVKSSDYVDIDECVITESCCLNIKEISENLSVNSEVSDGDDDDNDAMDSECNESAITTYQSLYKFAKNARLFALKSGDTDVLNLTQLLIQKAANGAIRSENRRQTTITDYFK